MRVERLKMKILQLKKHLVWRSKIRFQNTALAIAETVTSLISTYPIDPHPNILFTNPTDFAILQRLQPGRYGNC